MKHALFAFRYGEPNPIYITQLKDSDLKYYDSLGNMNLDGAYFDVMTCEDKGDLNHEIFHSVLTDKTYKYKEGMVFEPIS